MKGLVKFTIEECKDGRFDIMVRIPSWAEGSKINVNGSEIHTLVSTGKYAIINRSWKKGDTIVLDMPMEVQIIEGHPRIEEVRNQIAIKRGPIVYCIESPDLPKNTSILDVYFNKNVTLKAVHQSDFLGGVTTLQGELLLRKDKSESMYRTVQKPEFISYKTQLVPYFSWSNRGQAEMTVFMPVVWE